MIPPVATALQRWSTDDVSARQRFDYFVNALSSAIVPMRVDGVIGAFEAHMCAAEVGPVSLIHQQGTAHRSFRLREDVSRSGEHTFHMIVNRSCEWTISHRGDARVQPGEALIVDSRYLHDLWMPDGFDVIHLKFSADWARRWVRRPNDIVSRRIGAGSAWGPALASFLGSLSPHSLLNAAVPPDVLLDQIGAMIALVADEVGCSAGVPRDHAQLAERILDFMAQRCGERLLSAAEIAESLRIDETTLHSALAAGGKTFASVLAGLRLDVSVRMLRSQAFRHESLAAIAERAGFPSATALTRALRARHGLSPSVLRALGRTNEYETAEIREPIVDATEGTLLHLSAK